MATKKRLEPVAPATDKKKALKQALEQIEKKMKSDPVFNQTIKEITININSKR